MKKIKFIVGLLAIIVVFLIGFSFVSGVSAMLPPYIPVNKLEIDSRTVQIGGHSYKVSWETTQNNISKDVYVDIDYKLKSKKKKKTGTGTISIEKYKKNKLKITESYSGLAVDKVTYVRTKRSPKVYYWTVYKYKLVKNLKKPVTNKRRLVGKITSIKSINHKITGEDTTTNTEYEVNVTESYKITFKIYYYSKYPNLVVIEVIGTLISVNSSDDSVPFSDLNYHVTVELRKVNKKKLLVHYIYYPQFILTCGDNSPGHEYKYKKTKLSAKKYYKLTYKKYLKNNLSKIVGLEY
ncbi:MAG: hypothetical protein LBR24_00180 [Methanobrevibacter sp.]|jgi:hypothetical protein|nr:hypothetical protein [Methanobrevibacter sp.]